MDQHWVVYVVPCAIYGALFLFSLFFLFIAASLVTHAAVLWTSSFLVSFLLLLIAIHGFFITLLSESTSSIIITNKRVVSFHGTVPFRDDLLEISFEKLKTVEARRRGLLQNLLNYGSLHFEKYASVDAVPHPASVARDIYQAMGLQ